MQGKLPILAALAAVVFVPTTFAEKPSAVLPLTRLRLYETGVGYFERSGRLNGSMRLPVPAAQLDDALKTLVVLSDDQRGKLEGVEFGTRVTEQLGRALARLPTGADSVLDYEAVARSLTGSQVELVSGVQHVSGRLLQVLAADESGLETCAQPSAAKECVLQKQAALLFMRDSGELMRFALGSVERLRPLAAGDVNRLRAAVQSTAAEHTLHIRGSLSNALTLGYVAEAPLWRTTYRLLLTPGGATLQAWALLHNDSDEAWSRVRVELVNGEPDSFLFPLAAPRYARRRLVTPEHELPSVPQLLSRSADELWDRGEEGDIGLGGVGGTGYGYGSGGFSGSDSRSSDREHESSLLAIGNLAAHAEATGQESGALFRYALPAPVDLAAHASLLVPLMTEGISAARVSYFSDTGAQGQSALILRNTTHQTLPIGTIAIFEDGGFGGESALERMKPGQERLVPFGVDADVELEAKGKTSTETRQLVSFANDHLVEHFVRVQEEQLALQNRAASERTLRLELHVVNNARVEQADSVLVLEEGRVSAGYVVAATSKRQVTLKTTEGLPRGRRLQALTARELGKLAADAHLPAAQRAQLTAAGKALSEREQLAAKQRALASEIQLLKAASGRQKEGLGLVAKADPERGRALAAEWMRTQARLSECERLREAIDLEQPLAAARAALAAL